MGGHKTHADGCALVQHPGGTCDCVDVARKLLAERNRLQALVDNCAQNECFILSRELCPLGDPMHFDKDGCPSEST